MPPTDPDTLDAVVSRLAAETEATGKPAQGVAAGVTVRALMRPAGLDLLAWREGGRVSERLALDIGDAAGMLDAVVKPWPTSASQDALLIRDALRGAELCAHDWGGVRFYDVGAESGYQVECGSCGAHLRRASVRKPARIVWTYNRAQVRARAAASLILQGPAPSVLASPDMVDVSTAPYTGPADRLPAELRALAPLPMPAASLFPMPAPLAAPVGRQAPAQVAAPVGTLRPTTPRTWGKPAGRPTGKVVEETEAQRRKREAWEAPRKARHRRVLLAIAYTMGLWSGESWWNSPTRWNARRAYVGEMSLKDLRHEVGMAWTRDAWARSVPWFIRLCAAWWGLRMRRALPWSAELEPELAAPTKRSRKRKAAQA